MAGTRKHRKRPMITRHQIRNEAGRPLAVHARRDSPNGQKTTWWELPDGTKGLKGISVEALPLYGTESLAKQPDGHTVVVTEGEKAADALSELGIVAVATVTGANHTPCDDTLRSLLPYAVILWPDNDDPGQGHMRRIEEALHRLGHRNVRIVEWPEAPPKGDAADFTGDDAELKALLESAHPHEPLPAVDMAWLLDGVRDFIRRYVVLDDAQADAVTLWTAHTHAFDAAESTPYLSIKSPEKRSGKTRLLEALDCLVRRSWLTGRVTAAALYRRIDAEKPTLLLDESDSAFNSGEEYAEGLRGVLNTGHRRGGNSTVCVGQGANISYGIFSTFCPKAIAGIGRLPDTVEDRAISIIMKRRVANEKVERFRWRSAKGKAAPLREKLESWAGATAGLLSESRPNIPLGLDDRAADGWEPLLAIADAAGVEWGRRARKAALALSTGDSRDDDSLGVNLLSDIKAIFDERTEDCISTAALVGALVALEEAPWGDLKGKPLNARKLARFLRPYNIRSHNVRPLDGTQAKGYNREGFDDAWRRYIPAIAVPSVPSVPNTPPALNLESAAGTDGTDGTNNLGIQAENDGRRLYTISLAQELGFPHVSLGEREVDGRTVAVGVPGDRFAWEQAVRFWPSDMVGELIERMEEICK